MRTDPASRRIAIYAGPRAFGSGCRAALRGLGYELTCAPSGPADLRLVEERQLHAVPGVDVDPDTPIVLIARPRSRDVQDARVVARVAQPAQLHELYLHLQRALEPHPRIVPRVSTRLPARCIRADHRWLGAVLSLSEGGCLLRTSEPLALGARLNLQFALPAGDLIHTRARCIYQTQGDHGFDFSKTARFTREAIRSFVSQRLAVLPATAR